MEWTNGDQTCQAAVFIFKDDKREEVAWKSALRIERTEGPIRAELHKKKPTFLSALTAWNNAVDPGNAYLMIYAHMGEEGLSTGASGNYDCFVRWSQLAKALPQKVAVLWLVGCSSRNALTKLKPYELPVLGHVLVTRTDRNWQPLLRCFSVAISLDPITSNTDLLATVTERCPDLGLETDYYRASAGRPTPLHGEETL